MRHNIKGICKIYHEDEGWGWISIEGEDDVWVHFVVFKWMVLNHLLKVT